MPSESVWFREVDTALIKMMKNILKLPDKKGELKSIPVFVRKPDEDFKIEQYPMATIYNLYASRDSFRHNQELQIKERKVADKKIVLEKSAVPFSLYYQIDFFSTQQSHMNEMTLLWLANVEKSFNLKVLDRSGNERSSFVVEVDTLKKADYLERENRIFHSYLTYRVWVELDELIAVDEDMIIEIENRINKKKE